MIIVEWTRNFVKKWYPVRIAKKQDNYYLTPQSDAELKTKVFQEWFGAQRETPEDDFDGDPPPFIDGFCELPDHRSNQKDRAREIVADGATAKVAAEKTGLPYNLVCEATKDIRDAAKAEQIETTQKLLTEENSLQDIATQLAVNKSTISRRGQAETAVTCKVTSLHDSPSISNCTRNWKMTVNRATHVTLQKQILNALSAGKKTTGNIIGSVVGHPTSIKNELRRLLDNKKIIKIKHGVYALPPVSDEIEQPQPEQVESPVDQSLPEQVSRNGTDLWYYIYLIHNALLDKRMYTCAEIAAQAEVPPEICDAALDYMYNHVLVNAGVGEAYWLDSAAQQRCFEFLLSQTRFPNLLKAHFCLYVALEYRKLVEYWTVEGKLKMIDKVKADGAVVSDWDQMFSFVDSFVEEQVAPMKEKIKILEHAAAQCYQKACTEAQVKEYKYYNLTGR